VTNVAFSPDGKRFVTGFKDKTVRLWDSETAETLHVLQEHEHCVFLWLLAPTANATTIVCGRDLRLRLKHNRPPAKSQANIFVETVLKPTQNRIQWASVIL